jgi:hypothetical protein
MGYTDRLKISQACWRKVGQKLCRYINRHDGVRNHEHNCRSKESGVKNINLEASKEVNAKIVNCWVMTSCSFESGY